MIHCQKHCGVFNFAIKKWIVTIDGCQKLHIHNNENDIQNSINTGWFSCPPEKRIVGHFLHFFDWFVCFHYMPLRSSCKNYINTCIVNFFSISNDRFNALHKMRYKVHLKKWSNLMPATRDFRQWNDMQCNLMIWDQILAHTVQDMRTKWQPFESHSKHMEIKFWSPECIYHKNLILYMCQLGIFVQYTTRLHLV